VEEIAPTEADASRTTQILTSLIQILQAIPPKLAAEAEKTDAEAVHQFVDSLKVEQHKDRAIVTANVPLELIKRIATPDSAAAVGAAATTTPAH
jgi:hypothetical protein